MKYLYRILFIVPVVLIIMICIILIFLTGNANVVDKIMDYKNIMSNIIGKCMFESKG